MSDQPAKLLRWYDAVRRRLPWRESSDPYRIWVSEVMLQQTRVDTVVPYYRRFVERFPSVEELAAAPADEVRALWSGLGYYRRARQMHEAARQVVAAGGWPRNAAGLAKLAGIGPYTAAAVASIAFGERVPVLDGNVARVMSRVTATEADPARAAGRRHLLAAAAEYLDAERPGDSNQALMELGATICRPRGPRCDDCPLAADCRAFAAGRPEAYPPPRVRRPTVRVERLAVLVTDDSRLLLARRPPEAEVLAGAWELPWVERSEPKAAEAALAARHGGRWRLDERLGRVRHAITHRALEVEVWRAELAGDGVAEAAGPELGWFHRERLAELATSSLLTKALALDERDGAG